MLAGPAEGSSDSAMAALGAGASRSAVAPAKQAPKREQLRRYLLEFAEEGRPRQNGSSAGRKGGPHVGCEGINSSSSLQRELEWPHGMVELFRLTPTCSFPTVAVSRLKNLRAAAV